MKRGASSSLEKEECARSILRPGRPMCLFLWVGGVGPLLTIAGQELIFITTEQRTIDFLLSLSEVF